jgi:mycothiol synthase
VVVAVPGVTYRAYRSGDAPDVVALWQRSAPADAVSFSWFCDYVLLDPNFEPAGLVLACDADADADVTAPGALLGAAYAVRRRTPAAGTDLEPDTGWIPFFFVDPDARGRGIGSALLHRAIDFLRGLGRTQVDFGCYTPNYFLPGIDPARYPAGAELLRRKGFAVRYSPVAMDLSLVGFTIPADVAKLRAERVADGYAFGRPTPGDVLDVINFAAAEFAPDWGEAIRHYVLAGRSLDDILVIRRDSRVVAFCMYGAYRGIRERFGPFGVDSSLRGTGLGKVLLYDCLAQMVSDGLHSAWFLWTGEESPAGNLYTRAGFQVTRRFDVVRAVL